MGAGKTTESKVLAARERAVLISEDDWLSMLYPGQISTFEEYLLYSARLKPLARKLVADILESGANVVMDFPANTVQQRQWFVELADSIGAPGQLIYIKASDKRCLEQIAIRATEQPARARFDNETVFTEVTRFFQEPGENENIAIQVIEKDV